MTATTATVRDVVRSFLIANGGLKRTIKEYLRENFYGGILAGDFANQESGAVDPAGVCPTTPIWAW